VTAPRFQARTILLAGFLLISPVREATASEYVPYTVTSGADDHDAALDGVCETAPGNGSPRPDTEVSRRHLAASGGLR